jgi:hypothetical protein
MRLPRGSRRNRKSAGLARVSARPQHSVYPAVSHNDNHRRSEHEGHRVRKTGCDTSLRSVAGVMPREIAGYPVHRNIAIDAGARDWNTGSPAGAGGDCRVACPGSCKKSPRLRGRGRSGRFFSRDLGNRRAGNHLPGPGNEGVGEHVRTRFHMGALGPVKLRTTDPHRTKKTCFFCRTVCERANSSKAIQPFDLMSRRHPLSSTRAAGVKSASRSKPS